MAQLLAQKAAVAQNVPAQHISFFPEGGVKSARGGRGPAGGPEAALDAGVPFPHGCGSGECGSCKCELLGGDVRCDRYSPDERAIGGGSGGQLGEGDQGRSLPAGAKENNKERSK